MKSHTDGPLWAVASVVPVYGSDVAQARELTSTLDDLTSNGIAPAVNAIKGYQIQDLIGDGGSMNLDMLSAVTTTLGNLKAPLQRTANTVNGMQPFHLESLEKTMGNVRDALSPADTLVQQAD